MFVVCVISTNTHQVQRMMVLGGQAPFFRTDLTSRLKAMPMHPQVVILSSDPLLSSTPAEIAHSFTATNPPYASLASYHTSYQLLRASKSRHPAFDLLLVYRITLTVVIACLEGYAQVLQRRCLGKHVGSHLTVNCCRSCFIFCQPC